MTAAKAPWESKIITVRNPDRSTWLHRWPDLFDGLTAEQHRAVTKAVADNVLEGWRPTRDDIQALIDVVCGNTTTEDYINAVRTGSAVR
jgi:hypothetical protein